MYRGGGQYNFIVCGVHAIENWGIMQLHRQSVQPSGKALPRPQEGPRGIRPHHAPQGQQVLRSQKLKRRQTTEKITKKKTTLQSLSRTFSPPHAHRPNKKRPSHNWLRPQWPAVLLLPTRSAHQQCYFYIPLRSFSSRQHPQAKIL
jgi:hypothetical protein